MSNTRKNIVSRASGTIATGAGMLPGSKGSSMTRSKKAATTDFLLCLRPTDGRHPGKTFTGPASDKVKPLSFPGGTFVHWRREPVSDGRSLADALDRIAEAGTEYVIRADVVGDQPKTIRRTKLFDPRKPDRQVTIHGTPRHWGMLDLDDLSNAPGLDSRNPAAGYAHAQGTVAFILSILPLAIASSYVAVEWSSSFCAGLPVGKAPSHIRSHLWVYFDTALDETQWKDLSRRLRAFAAAQLRSRHGVDHVAPSFLDLKVTEAQQPLFVAQPRFVDGAKDPFPGRRRLRHKGSRPTVSLADLERELAEDEANRPVAPVEMRVTKVRKQPTEKVARLNKADAVPAAPSIVALDLVRATRDALAAASEARADGNGTYKERCLRVFTHRALLETFALIVRRREAGEHDPRWSAWHQQGGVPAGQRDLVATLITSLVVEAAPLGLSVDEVRERSHRLLRMAVDNTWLSEEWIARGWTPRS